jgi:putative membrane protein
LYYDIIKSFHLVAVISWMVGLLYLPRLFVYHNDAKYNTELDQIFLLMENRLLKIIMMPAIVLTYVLGFTLVYYNNYLITEYYFILKIFFVLFLTIFHLYLSRLYKSFEKGYRIKSTVFYKKINEIPTILMIIIILLVIVKPDLSYLIL